MKKVYGLIRRLGANSKYKGYFFVAEAVKISMGDQCKPLRITKDIYPCLARKYRSTPTNIEHDIRTMVNVCWEGNKKLLIPGQKAQDHIIPELLRAFIHRECFERGSGSTKKAVIFKLKI